MVGHLGLEDQLLQKVSCLHSNGSSSAMMETQKDRLQMAWTPEQEEEEGQEPAAITSALQLAAVDTSGCAASLMLYRCLMSSLCAGVERCKVRGVPAAVQFLGRVGKARLLNKGLVFNLTFP